MMIDPQQELFSALLINLRDNCDTYDGSLPPKDTPYPFYYLADNTQIDSMTKSNSQIGQINQTIHIWHNNVKQRGTVSSMLAYAKSMCYAIQHTANCSFSVSNVEQRILNDNTTNTPLLHGVLEIRFNYSGRSL